MPEEKVKYTAKCPCCGRSNPKPEPEPEPEPELICPLRMLALERTTRIVKADSPAANGHVECLKDKCAWWMQSLEMCSIQAIPDASSGLYEMLDEIRGKL